MTTEELIVAIRVTAEDAEETIKAIREETERMSMAVERLSALGRGAFEPLTEGAGWAAAAQSALAAALTQTLSGAMAAAGAMDDLGEGASDAGDELTRLQRTATQTDKKLRDALDFRQQIRQMKSLAQQVKDSGGSWDDLGDGVKAFARRMGVAEGDIDGVILALDGMQTQTDTSATQMTAQLQGMLGTLEALRAEMVSIPPAELTADASQAISAISALIAMINAVLALAGQAGISLGEGSGGGSSRAGGGGGAGGSGTAASAARDAERAQEEIYRSELERIEHRRHMGELTAQEEIAALERVKRAYAKTAEQIMDIDERIYDARQALRESEQGKITTLYDAIVDALEARYEAQREIEQRRISESIAAWEAWSDETCAAIQKQIDALDEQAQAEDREKTRAENLRKIGSLEQALVYETDEYNRLQLSRQLEQAREAWEEIQADWAREDQKAALEAQMLAVQTQAQEEIAALEAESERIDSVYDALTDGQALAAEAQKQMMHSGQEELLALLAEYAPDYEATGRTLGEKLYEGFAAAFGDITTYFARLDAQFEALTDEAQRAALSAGEALKAEGQAQAAVSAPVINQTVNFNQPVESPADVTRRMQQVSEELAGMI